MTVDLRLAVNYLPACGCVANSILLALLIVWGRFFLGYPAYVFLTALLVMHKVLFKPYIIDSSAILLGILGANIVAEVRTHQRVSMHWGSLYVFNTFWIVGCVNMIVEAHHLRMIFERVNRDRFVALWYTLTFFSLISLIHEEQEFVGFVVVRSFAYATCCVAWTYIVGLHTSVLAEESGLHFTPRMAPLLLSPPYLAGCFWIFAVAGLLYQYRKTSQVKATVLHEVHEVVVSTPKPVQQQEAVSDEALFMSAKKNIATNSNSEKKLQTIFESQD